MLLLKRPGCPNNVYLMQKVTSKGSILMTGIQRNRITRIVLRKVTSRVFQKKGVSVLRISGKSVVIFCGNLRLVHLKQNLWYLSASFSCRRMYFFYRFVIKKRRTVLLYETCLLLLNFLLNKILASRKCERF